MAGPLVSPPEVDDPDGDPLVMGVDDDRADEVLSALSSTTTRQVLAALHDDPAPPSDLADRLDTSVQNVQYHIGKLDDADLVEAAGTAYSAKGREMTVYAPADRALVFVAGPGDGGGAEDDGLVATLKRVLGGVGALAVASVVVDRVLSTRAGRGLLGPGIFTGSRSEATETEAGGGGDATATEGGTRTAAEATAETSTPAATETATPPGGDGGATTGTATGTDGRMGVYEATATETPAATPTPEATPATATDAATSTPTEMATETATSADLATETVRVTTEVGGGLDAVAHSPGLLFFLGGLVALALAVGLVGLR